MASEEISAVTFISNTAYARIFLFGVVIYLWFSKLRHFFSFFFYLQASPIQVGDDTWKTAPLPQVSPGRKRNVPRLRAMSGHPLCVPPNFNEEMEAVWLKLWSSMPQRGSPSTLVKTLLDQYREHSRIMRKKRGPGESPPALLPVSFAHAKEWLLRQQREESSAIEAGVVNTIARNLTEELTACLQQQPESALAALDRPARPAQPVVPESQPSSGPQPITLEDRVKDGAVPRRKASDPGTRSLTCRYCKRPIGKDVNTYHDYSDPKVRKSFTCT